MSALWLFRHFEAALNQGRDKVEKIYFGKTQALRKGSVHNPQRAAMAATSRSANPRALPTAEDKIETVVQRLLADHSIDREFFADDDLRDVGLTSLDMASLVLSVEAEFDLLIPERHITPGNFRSVATITKLVMTLVDAKPPAA
jgi:acyl carrier protein